MDPYGRSSGSYCIQYSFKENEETINWYKFKFKWANKKSGGRKLFHVNTLKMLEPAMMPKVNSPSSTDSFDWDSALIKHHRALHKQVDVVNSTANELLDYGEYEDDLIDCDLLSDLPEVTCFSTQASLLFQRLQEDSRIKISKVHPLFNYGSKF